MYYVSQKSRVRELAAAEEEVLRLPQYRHLLRIPAPENASSSGTDWGRGVEDCCNGVHGALLRYFPKDGGPARGDLR